MVRMRDQLNLSQGCDELYCFRIAKESVYGDSTLVFSCSSVPHPIHQCISLVREFANEKCFIHPVSFLRAIDSQESTVKPMISGGIALHRVSRPD